MGEYETHILKDPQLPFIFHKKTRLRAANRNSIQPNWHENVEILYILHGTGRIEIDAQHFELHEGDIVVVNSNCLHCVCTTDALLIYNCLIVDRSFCLANFFDTNKLLFTPVFRDLALADLMTRLQAEYTPPYRTAFRVQTIRALVMEIMASLCRDHTLPESTVRKESSLISCIKQAIGYIRTNSSQEISLDDVSKFVGLSKYHFAREFRRITGHTFVSYVNLIRCEKAKHMLTEDHLAVGEIGHACGFENQSYFSKIFRSYTGLTPKDYREKMCRGVTTR